MKLPDWLCRWLRDWAYRVANDRLPDFVLEDCGTYYLLRWHVIPPNRWLSVYVHLFIEPDFGRHLHDHRSGSLSVILDGEYEELWAEPRMLIAGTDGVHSRRTKGEVIYRTATRPHRITSTPGALTLFVTGPTTRNWGFWVDGVWMPHERYLQQQGPK
jgi:hypothetical protein